MRRNEVFPSNYLGKDDIETPIAATIADVRLESLKTDTGATDDKPVCYFPDGDGLKPMILNQTNWLILEDAYGDDSDFWRGKPVEIYVDPGVMYGGRRVGGLRVRIPAAPKPQTPPPGRVPQYGNTPRNGTPSPAAPRPQVPAPKPQAPPPPSSPAEKLALAVNALARVRTEEKAREWATWFKGLSNITPDMEDELSDAYHSAIERITRANDPAPPELVGAQADRDVPF